MTFRETFYNVKGLLEDRLHDFGLESADASTMGWTTMLSIEQNTRVTIDVPLNLVYSDEFLITGTLETSTYSRLNGKTVKLKVGNTVVDTTTTNVNGEYSFTQIPVSTGTHSFQVIFEGTNIYAASESSIVTRTSNKETSVMNLNAQSTKHYGDNVILSGTLLTDDGEYIKNASVKYYVNNVLMNTLTTNNYGVFTMTRSIGGFDSLNIQFVYEGDSNYTSVSASQTVDVYQLDLRLTSDKNILSYADNESATITAQLIDDAPTPQELKISDYNIIFSVPTNYTDISDIATDNTGKATFTYNSQGIGDVTISANIEGSLVSKTYDISDRDYYNSLLEDINAWRLTNTDGTLTVQSNGMKFLQATGSHYGTGAILNVPLDLINYKYEVEFDLVDYNTSDNTPIRHQVTDLNGLNNTMAVQINTTAFTLVMGGNRTSSTSLPKPSHFKLHLENGNHILWVNGSQRATSSMTFSEIKYWSIWGYKNQFNVVANFSIKKID